MPKETFYFSHDYGSRNDPKIQKLLMRLGQAGKGVYWDLIEMLYEQEGYLLLSECESYAFALRTTNDCITSLINDFDLFKNDGVKFWSKSVLERLNKRIEKSEKASKSAKTRWFNANASKKDKNALHSESDSNAIKESKGKESKGKSSQDSPNEKIFESNLFRKPNIPSFEDVHRVFVQRGGTEEMARKFFNGHESTGWFFKGSAITNYVSMVPGFIDSWKNYSKNGQISPEKVKITLD